MEIETAGCVSHVCVVLAEMYEQQQYGKSY
jgi:hypothetical protein